MDTKQSATHFQLSRLPNCFDFVAQQTKRDLRTLSPICAFFRLLFILDSLARSANCKPQITKTVNARQSQTSKLQTTLCSCLCFLVSVATVFGFCIDFYAFWREKFEFWQKRAAKQTSLANCKLIQFATKQICARSKQTTQKLVVAFCLLL